jgi:transposase, IS5 family
MIVVTANAADVPKKNHNGQISAEESHVPFGGTLDPDIRWVIFSTLMPWEKLEELYALQFNPKTDVLAKPIRLAFGSLFIKYRLVLSDEESVEQIRENASMLLSLPPYPVGLPLAVD